MEVLTQEKSLVSQKVTVTNTDKSCEEQAHKVQLSPDMGTKEGFQPTLELSAKEDLMDNISVQSMEVGEEVDEQGWKSSKTKKSRNHKKKQVMMATRTSQRVLRDGIPIATKAENRAMAKNILSGDTHNPFTVLNSTPNAILHKVLMDLELESENLDEHIDAFKAEEIARAAIAEANYKCFLEKQLEKTCPRDDEQI